MCRSMEKFEVSRSLLLAELLHVRHDLRRAGCGDRRADPRRLADALLTSADVRRIVTDPCEARRALAEAALAALNLVLGLELFDDVHTHHLRRSVPRGADDLLGERLGDQDHAGAQGPVV